MKVDDIKIALKRSDGAHRSVARALEQFHLGKVL